MLAWIRNRRRRKILRSPWPDGWDELLQQNVRQYARLNAPLRQRLRKCVSVIVAEKKWEALDGLQVTDEIRVTIAGLASLMLLGVDEYYFDGVRTILVYPKPFRRKTRNGWVVDEDQHLSGEAWQGGPIVLSWHDVVYGARHPQDGQNLVVHEFAHHLDSIDGEMGGSLMFSDNATNQLWRQVMQREFTALQLAVRRGHHTLLDEYGATNEAEFFAVASETFFERPERLRSRHRELFDLLVKYYRLDPIQWQLAER